MLLLRRLSRSSSPVNPCSSILQAVTIRKGSPMVHTCSPDTAHPTSVHPPELFRRHRTCDLSELFNLSETASGNFRHSGWADQRARMLDALMDAGYDCSRLYRFTHCGDDAFVIRARDNPDNIRVAGSACHDRWCLPCARDRSRTIAANLLSLTNGKKLRLLTLTLHHNPVPLWQELDRLQACFTQLRRSKFWKACVQGGVALIEVARGVTRSDWHPHLHVIFEGVYMPQKVLSNIWRAITGDSYIVDIRAIESEAMLINYVTKYVSKPWTGAVERSPVLMLEVVRAMEGRRLCTTFGSWRGMPLTVKPISDEWEVLGSLSDYLYRAKAGDSEARATLSRLDPTVIEQCLGLLSEPSPEPRPPPKELFLFETSWSF